MDAGKYLDQGRFPCAVVTQKDNGLPQPQFSRDAPQRVYPSKGFANVFELDYRSHDSCFT